jgi:hypothetical protein
LERLAFCPKAIFLYNVEEQEDDSSKNVFGFPFDDDDQRTIGARRMHFVSQVGYKHVYTLLEKCVLWINSYGCGKDEKHLGLV